MRPTEQEVLKEIEGASDLEARDIWKAAFATNPKLINSEGFIAWLKRSRKIETP
jgi:hypothetical protein